MKFGNRRPGTSTTFVDAFSEEHLLQFASDEHGQHLMAFHLYDSAGSLVGETAGLEHYPDGVTICSNGGKGEVLLCVPPDTNDAICYRLYNCNGNLLTSSDGVRTKIYQLLRMEGVGRDWAPPLAVPAG